VLEATVATGGAEWLLAAVHLHARARLDDEAKRQREIAAILQIFADRRAASRPHLLVGDFNANSPIQRVDPAKCKPRTRQDIEANGGILPRAAIQMLLSAGYVDTLPAVVGSEAQTIGSFTTEHPGQRVDYVFAYGIAPDRLRDACVVRDGMAHQASDHFPVMAEID